MDKPRVPKEHLDTFINEFLDPRSECTLCNYEYSCGSTGKKACPFSEVCTGLIFIMDDHVHLALEITKVRSMFDTY